jgi:hypothetical protein
MTLYSGKCKSMSTFVSLYIETSGSTDSETETSDVPDPDLACPAGAGVAPRGVEVPVWRGKRSRLNPSLVASKEKRNTTNSFSVIRNPYLAPKVLP